jgi:ornithine--oxo-acid transaminase
MDTLFDDRAALASGTPTVSPAIACERRYGARNYDPLPVVLAHGDGCWLWDEHGRRYLDMMSAYSAVSHGHAHPRIVAALVGQAQRLAVTSRVFHNQLLPAFLERLTKLTGLDRALPANGGAEAVETALKAARKWGYRIKGIPADRAEIIVCAGNFHGRSIAIVGFSSESQYRDGFGPFPPGFRQVPFGDAEALARTIGPNTAAFLVEPIQGEGGIVVPPAGYLAQCARICRERDVLLICDEIQTGMGRTGKFLACEHDDVRPDGVILGKALGGGLLPVSALVGTDDLMQVFTPGDHGSTFGGNALAAAVGLAALDVLFDEGLIGRSAEQGAHLLAQLSTVKSPLIREVRGRGLFVGIEVDRARIAARDVVDRLLARGILSKDTNGTVVRFAPPLTIERDAIDWAVEEVRAVFTELGDGLRRAA